MEKRFQRAQPHKDLITKINLFQASIMAEKWPSIMTLALKFKSFKSSDSRTQKTDLTLAILANLAMLVLRPVNKMFLYGAPTL